MAAPADPLLGLLACMSLDDAPQPQNQENSASQPADDETNLHLELSRLRLSSRGEHTSYQPPRDTSDLELYQATQHCLLSLPWTGNMTEYVQRALDLSKTPGFNPIIHRIISHNTLSAFSRVAVACGVAPNDFLGEVVGCILNKAPSTRLQEGIQASTSAEINQRVDEWHTLLVGLIVLQQPAQDLGEIEEMATSLTGMIRGLCT